MSSIQKGTVKWVDNEGTGYVTVDGHNTSYPFDQSTTVGSVASKQQVTFTIVNVLGRNCAFKVTAI